MKKIILMILLLVLASGLVGCPWHHHGRHPGHHHPGPHHYYDSR